MQEHFVDKPSDIEQMACAVERRGQSLVEAVSKLVSCDCKGEKSSLAGRRAISS